MPSSMLPDIIHLKRYCSTKIQEQRSTVAKSKGFDSTKAKKSGVLDELGKVLFEQLYPALGVAEPRDGPTVPIAEMHHCDFNTPLAATWDGSACGSSPTLIENPDTTSLEDHNSSGGSTRSILSIAQLDPGAKYSKLGASLVERDPVLCLDDIETANIVSRLGTKYGRMAHMGLLDRNYRIFVNNSQTAALLFKVQNGVAIVAGDPLCETQATPGLLAEFATYRRRKRWDIAFMGVSESFIGDFTCSGGWTTIRFGMECVLNLQVDGGVERHCRKRVLVQSRQLLHPQKGGVTLGVYEPSVHGTDTQLQMKLTAIYDTWRAERNDSKCPQAFVTIYDLFLLPGLMIFVYSRGPDGQVNGFAALRRTSSGYNIDPCIATADSARGITDLLVVAVISLLSYAGVSQLGLGYEPQEALSTKDITGLPSPLTALARNFYQYLFQRLPIHGKKAYFDKFRPERLQGPSLYLAFPHRGLGPRHLLAMCHLANISLRQVLWADFQRLFCCC